MRSSVIHIPPIRIERGAVDSIQSIISETEFHHVLIVSGKMRDNAQKQINVDLETFILVGILEDEL